MNDVFSKISSYHLFNYLLPGCLFALAATKITNREFLQQNIILGLFLYYFYGLVIGQVGTLIVEPALRGIRLLRFAEYSKYVAASAKDPKIDVLSESNNMYRSFCSLLLALIALKGYAWLEIKVSALTRWDGYLLTALLLLMFLFAYRKQTSYIAQRVDMNH
jgi:hypothetical protein